jgi:hypothetical protein
MFFFAALARWYKMKGIPEEVGTNQKENVDHSYSIPSMDKMSKQVDAPCATAWLVSQVRERISAKVHSMNNSKKPRPLHSGGTITVSRWEKEHAKRAVANGLDLLNGLRENQDSLPTCDPPKIRGSESVRHAWVLTPQNQSYRQGTSKGSQLQLELVENCP